jgi:hypothetical protein
MPPSRCQRRRRRVEAAVDVEVEAAVEMLEAAVEASRSSRCLHSRGVLQ